MNEFANIPTINAIDKKVSIGLGAEMLFNFVIQNLEQLEIHYSKDQAATLKANCSNWTYILTNTIKTAKELSEMIGNRTVKVTSNSSRYADPHTTNLSDNYISQPILSPVELTNFMGGEMVTLRTVYRQDQKGNSIAAFPIFSHGITKMPYRKDFLADEYDDQRTIANLGLRAPHRDFSLEDNRINFAKTYLDLIKDEMENTQVEESSSDIEFAGDQTALEETKDPILSNEALTVNHNLEMLSAIVPNFIADDRNRDSLFEQLKDNPDFWRDPNHNDWNYLESLCDGYPENYELLKKSINEQIKSYVKEED